MASTVDENVNILKYFAFNLSIDLSLQKKCWDFPINGACKMYWKRGMDTWILTDDIPKKRCIDVGKVIMLTKEKGLKLTVTPSTI